MSLTKKSFHFIIFELEFRNCFLRRCKGLNSQSNIPLYLPLTARLFVYTTNSFESLIDVMKVLFYVSCDRNKLSKGIFQEPPKNRHLSAGPMVIFWFRLCSWDPPTIELFLFFYIFTNAVAQCAGDLDLNVHFYWFMPLINYDEDLFF